MSQLTNVLRLHAKNHFSWITLPWAILLIPCLGINLFIAFFVEPAIYTGALSSIYIFMLVLGCMTLSDTFPFALSLSIRRTDYFLGTMLMLVTVSAGSALGILLFALLEQYLFPGWGVGLHFFSLPYFNVLSPIGQFWVYFSIFVHIFLLGFAISSIYYRFGRTGMYAFFVILTVASSLGSFLVTYFNQWNSVWSWFIQTSPLTLSLWLLPLTIACALFSYISLRKATV